MRRRRVLDIRLLPRWCSLSAIDRPLTLPLSLNQCLSTRHRICGEHDARHAARHRLSRTQCHHVSDNPLETSNSDLAAARQCRSATDYRASPPSARAPSDTPTPPSGPCNAPCTELATTSHQARYIRNARCTMLHPSFRTLGHSATRAHAKSETTHNMSACVLARLMAALRRLRAPAGWCGLPPGRRRLTGQHVWRIPYVTPAPYDPHEPEMSRSAPIPESCLPLFP